MNYKVVITRSFNWSNDFIILQMIDTGIAVLGLVEEHLNLPLKFSFMFIIQNRHYLLKSVLQCVLNIFIFKSINKSNYNNIRDDNCHEWPLMSIWQHRTKRLR